jgi:hypothetical protein
MSLLDAGPPSETSSLVQTIEEASVSAFSSHGWRSLLYHLWDLSRNTTSPRGSAPHLLVELTVKYLVFAPDHHMQGEPDTQQEIRDRLLPWIRNSEGSLSDFQTALRTLLTDTRTHVTSEQRARLVEWLRDADSWSVAKVH